ncbi:SixA phosphatase family protein [Pseudobacter ginsenosidimutans]|uniref:Histidine phosphatase superfamily protein (Branch 1) n=1 Tax=Pseudobacter ginsenosidimutans TaxID=661488 RepID=A0A4Q7MFM5_9BACT|nr:phosphoglycerate mutase family protein [Pseudobacter ginsenosidimutans]QEC45406.1 histidine phosphatase family protein [Pseudobacter ginsenosidimutans]RZS66934.1 histidine phosphatase superfamily protein (branch 1) [Pseudobacter ginsenosidimutans]
MKCLPTVFLFMMLTGCSHTYYVVRHAEKAVPGDGPVMNTPNDPPLSTMGLQRADALKKVLHDKNIRHIYSTNTIRTRSTAEPLSKLMNIPVQIYGPRPDSAFIQQMKLLKRNTLIVGHSNTIDDIANGLAGETKVDGDLPETVYDQIFIIHYRKGGKKILFERVSY